MRIRTSGLVGLASTAIGIVMLLFTFYNAYLLFQGYVSLTLQADFLTAVNEILVAAIRAMFLAVMAWVGSILLLRGVDFMKVDRGVGVVTFRVEKGVGVATIPEQQERRERE